MLRYIATITFVTLPLLAANGWEGLIDQLRDLDTSLKILFLFTILSLAPAILITMTSFVRIIIVLSLLRQAMGVPQAPPNQVLIALALFLTFFIMKPVYQQIDQEAIRPYMAKQIDDMTFLQRAIRPIKRFMLHNTSKKDLKLFLKLANEHPKSLEELSWTTLAPAFLVSEIKIAFEIAFVIFLPFLVIDMLVASILMSMGMMMIPPMMISLPFKLILFILSDGWELLIEALIRGYQ
ncbi:MAG: flagellar biosynthetic protein FliP [Nitratiruptor sp.]|nr:flagellar biosynthetic protein FliP [Nitratiruptor sp.]NPA84276.1 flagellar type III secretion system pore protein FliP [Campylobacterota bacterium]